MSIVLDFEIQSTTKCVSCRSQDKVPHLLSFVQHLGHSQFIFDVYGSLAEEMAFMLDSGGVSSLNALFCSTESE